MPLMRIFLIKLSAHIKPLDMEVRFELFITLNHSHRNFFSIIILITFYSGRDKVLKHLHNWTISVRPVLMFVQSCVECNLKKSKSRNIVTRPILSENFLSRGQVDLIDLHQTPCTVKVRLEIYKSFQGNSEKIQKLKSLDNNFSEQTKFY